MTDISDSSFEKQNGLTGYLVVDSGTDNAYFFELEADKILEIGRKPGEPDGPRKLVLPNQEVSSHHAELRSSLGGCTLRDVGSTNGTRLNGNWITSGQDYLLKNGDQIKIAQINLIVNLPDTSPQRSGITKEKDENERTHLHINLMTATILVADIRSFTGLMETYSAEPGLVMQAAQKVFRRFDEEIRRQHGQVEKIAGDAVMAYWQGADDHNICAHQACSTALSLKAMVPLLAECKEDWPFPDHPLKVDMALATGPVAAGVFAAGNANLSVLGDTANLAFRLEKLIGDDWSGDIIIDGTTQAMVKDNFQTDSLGQFTVKGRQRQVDVHRLVSAISK